MTAISNPSQAIKTAPARRMNKPLPPQPTYDDKLPIVKHRGAIIDAIRENQVIVVCGETGSGKTTQLPKLCLDAGRGRDGVIGHTQPRRIAARTVAGKIAAELGSEIGQFVGFKVRHTDKTAQHSRIKLMTDGILLSELRHDHRLSGYDTIIIDEAHERNLNIDFLLGYLHDLLPRRPELKLIVTSATIEVERFAGHFGRAPVVEVAGRMYPIEVRYFPATEERHQLDRDAHLAAAIDQLVETDRGDVLVFMEGEAEIHEAAAMLRKKKIPNTDILPLYSRLDAARQRQLFLPHRRRHIILATNVAETSLTIPGVRHVIDTGYARVSRYSYRSKIQRLPVEKISRASANQRAGRCGRTASGICIRLYSEQDFAARAEFTEAEIVRTNLAAVILQMQYMGLGEIDDFPFIDPPDRRFVNDGKRLLKELGAIDDRNRLTATGRRLIRFPVDPRHGRILMAGHQLNCLTEIIIIISALSIRDPRERPTEKSTKADHRHARFNDDRSDFLWFVNFWKFYHQRSKRLSKGQLKKLCRDNFVAYARVREWGEVHRQLLGICGQLRMSMNREPAAYASIHSALIYGFLSHIAFKSDAVAYTGARNLRLHLFPGSGQFGKKPKWVVASDLIETSRLYARNVAKIDPKWLVQAAKHLIEKTHTDPYWDQQSGRVYVDETASLYGMILYSGRKTDYGSIDREGARDIFIHEALLAERFDHPAEFLQKNRRLVAGLSAMEAKKRRRDIIDETALFDFYADKLPTGVYDAESFSKWAAGLDERAEDALILSEKDVANPFDPVELTAGFPDQCKLGDAMLRLNYQFQPKNEDDGINVTVPLNLLNQLDETTCDYLVTGIIEEKIYRHLKSLPKKCRKLLVPLPDAAKKCAAAIADNKTPLRRHISEYLFIHHGIKLGEESLRNEHIPDHLRINYCVIDAHGKPLAKGRDLSALKQRLDSEMHALFNELNTRVDHQRELSDWDFGDLDEDVFIEVNGEKIKCYPALVKTDDKVYLRLFDSADRAKLSMPAGLRQLFIIAMDRDFGYLRRNIPDAAILERYYAKIGANRDFYNGFIDLIATATFVDGDTDVRSRRAFKERCAAGKTVLLSRAVELSRLLKRIFELHVQISTRLNRLNGTTADDIYSQLSYLIYDGFLTDVPLVWLNHYPRYLTAVDRRIDKASYAGARQDPDHRQLAMHWRRLCDMLNNDPRAMVRCGRLQTYRWMMEELRVSLYAQQLKTAMPVSLKRLEKLWQSIKADPRQAAGAE